MDKRRVEQITPSVFSTCFFDYVFASPAIGSALKCIYRGLLYHSLYSYLLPSTSHT